MKLQLAGAAMVILLGGVQPPTVLADMAINMRGNLVMPPCTVNNNAPVNVELGEFQKQVLTAADTPFLARDFDIPLDCPYNQGAPMLTLTASGVHDTASGAIQTTKYSEGLIIYLRQKGGITPVPLGTPTDVTGSMSGSENIRTLTLNVAVGRYMEPEALHPGSFTASASLQVIYE